MVWVGIGEGNGTGDTTVAGVYRSLDGGDTWAAAGLLGIEGVHRILLHPSIPEIVYAGVSGLKWEDGEARGVHKTTDGGQTWNRVLFVDEGTGCLGPGHGSDRSRPPSCGHVVHPRVSMVRRDEGPG